MHAMLGCMTLWRTCQQHHWSACCERTLWHLSSGSMGYTRGWQPAQRGSHRETQRTHSSPGSCCGPESDSHYDWHD